jgi:hypothetical protein
VDDHRYALGTHQCVPEENKDDVQRCVEDVLRSAFLGDVKLDDADEAIEMAFLHCEQNHVQKYHTLMITCDKDGRHQRLLDPFLLTRSQKDTLEKLLNQ